MPHVILRYILNVTAINQKVKTSYVTVFVSRPQKFRKLQQSLNIFFADKDIDLKICTRCTICNTLLDL